MALAIQTHGLKKTYRRRGGRTVAIDDLDLNVPEGVVFGFLGPNGSGKTTTIRCLLGLVKPSGGSAEILGQPVPGGLAGLVPHVGAIVESPAFFPTMTGFTNLQLLARVDRIGDGRVNEVLELVGLAERSGDLVKHYSLGMRQRLGLGAALLKDPDLVILDEPANGLDPAGIREVRVLLRTLAGEGRTVFVSSHILAEVEHTCDSVAILRKGRCVAQGSVEEIMARATSDTAMLVTVADLDAGRTVLHRAGFTTERQNGALRVETTAGGAAEITKALAAQGLWVTGLTSETKSLEDLFLEMTGDDDRIPTSTDEELIR